MNSVRLLCRGFDSRLMMNEISDRSSRVVNNDDNC